MITIEQLKDVKERTDALRRYLLTSTGRKVKSKKSN